MASPSLSLISREVSNNPFLWPHTLTLHDLCLLLCSGNARPAPGPDGWEKWFIKHLSDPALEIVLKLANYIILSSHFTACLKPTNISTIHKRGPNTVLSNYRDIAVTFSLISIFHGLIVY
jgi:hypothetical protein